MPQSDDTGTVQAFVDSALKQISGTVDLVAHQDSIGVVGDTYTVRFSWVLGDDAEQDDIPPYPGGEMQLTADTELTVSPTFSITDEHIDSVTMTGSPSHDMGSTRGDAEADEKGFETLATLLNEVHLTESKFVDMIEGDTQLSECIELVSVVQGGSDKHEEAIEKANQMLNESEQFGETDSVDLDNRLQFIIELMSNGEQFPIADGLPTKDRFTHVETLTINGTRYPVTISTFLFGSGELADGQTIYVGEFTASCDETTPQISLQDELDHIDWREFVADPRAWPERPGLPERHRTGEIQDPLNGMF